MATAARVFPAQPLKALGTILSLTALLWVVEFYDQLTGERLDQDGIVPRSVDGLDGIVWAPLLHGGWAHLVANTLRSWSSGSWCWRTGSPGSCWSRR